MRRPPDPIQRTLLRALAATPPPLARVLGASAPVEGKTIDPILRLFLRFERVAGIDTTRLSPEEARADLERSVALIGAPPVRDVRIEQRSIEAGEHGAAARLALRVFRPAAGSPDGSRPPALLYFHGGGGVVGSLDSHHALCATLARGARAVVISVDYRLAPEHRFPAAVDDAVAAFDWLEARAVELGVDARRLAIGGDSHGGNLAAGVCLRRAAAARPQPALQVLLYPWLDLSGSQPSRQTYGRGYLLSREVLGYFRRHYLGNADPSSPSASPLFAAARDLAAVAPAIVLTAGFDPLLDEGRRYADRLDAAGVAVRYRCYDDVIHGFGSLAPVIPACGRALDDAVDEVARALDALGREGDR